ncbi:solute carrier family 22 member 18 isoform X2 [Ambystoma mexicanum]|uniref:solute carrier family 22 member 18 isoform X2 n=1 Tax=Ambystoma mexicanum TaxID=8296 RepID=UPI0037E8D48E
MEQEGNEKRAMSQSELENMSNKRFVMRVAYLLSAADISCLFMQLSTIPYLAKNLGLESVGFGCLQTVFGLLQLIGGPIFGRFSDQFGVRAALTLSFLSGSLFYLLSGIATNIPLLFISRIPGMFMHGLPGAQMVITHWTTPAERAGALGKFGLCMGLGMIIGSSLGGFLATKVGLQCPTFVGLAGSLLSTLVVLTYIPAQPELHEPDTKQDVKRSSVFNFKEITRLLRLPGVFPVFTVRLCSGLPVGFFMITFAVISINFFGLNPEQSGYLMSYIGVVQMALMSNVFQFCVIVLPLVFALATLTVITDSILTKSVPSSDTGAMLGICASVHPLTRTVGPTIGGILYQAYGVSSFGCLHFAVNAVLVFYLLRKKMHLKEQKLE